MCGKATAQREKKSDENHRQGDDRETDVRDEQREVDITNRALALKAHVAVKGVIGDVCNQEKRGKDKRREHGRPVLADALGANEAETDDEGDGGEGVEQGVERRKEEQVRARNVGGCMIINEPTEEEAGNGTDSDYNGDDAERSTVLVGRECRHGVKAKIIDFLLLPRVDVPQQVSLHLRVHSGPEELNQGNFLKEPRQLGGQPRLFEKSVFEQRPIGARQSSYTRNKTWLPGRCAFPRQISSLPKNGSVISPGNAWPSPGARPGHGVLIL